MRAFRYPILLVALCTSCAFGSSSTSDSLALASSNLGLEKLSSDPYLYEVQSGSTGTGTYVTAIKDCSLNAKTSAKAATRQLLVGFKNIKIIEQSSVTINDQACLRSRITAEDESGPVELSVYSRRQGRCIIDLAFWGTPQANESALAQGLFANMNGDA